MSAPVVNHNLHNEIRENAFSPQEMDSIVNSEKLNPFANVFSSNAPVPSINILANNTNYSVQSNPVLNEINALSNNFDKLDNILIKSTGSQPLTNNKTTLPILPNQLLSSDNESLLPQSSSSNVASSVGKKLNPFAKILDRPKSPSLNDMVKKDGKKEITETTNTSPSKISNPFARSESFLSRNNKYDAFKNAIEFESFSMVAGTNENKNENFSGGSNNICDNGKNKFFNNSNNFNEFSNRLIESSPTSSHDIKFKVIIAH